MTFISLEYILFLPIVVFAYYWMQHKHRWALLLSASYLFYGYWNASFLIFIAISTLIDYWAGLKMEVSPEKRARKKFLYLSLGVNLGMLFFFKYFSFLNEAVRNFLSIFEQNYPIEPLDIILPIGISFYTFQTLSYTIDVYRGKRKAERHLGKFATYVSFFPQLVAGPIESSTTLLPQISIEQKFKWSSISAGFRLILWGAFKKLIIADHLYLFTNAIYAQPMGYSGGTFALATLSGAIWIYSDFSGYTDMAIGSARLFGIQLSPNFKRPYFSTSIKELWSRWHISLTRWVNEYIHLPLTKKVNSTFTRYLTTLFIFFIIGLWHGANWTFIIFGLIHGFYIIYHRLTRNIGQRVLIFVFGNKEPVHTIINGGFTFLLWCFSGIFFLSPSIQNSIYVLKHLFSAGNHSLLEHPYLYSIAPWVLLMSVPILVLLEVKNKQNDENPINTIKPTIIRWALYLLMLYMIICFGNTDGSDFFYFQF